MGLGGCVSAEVRVGARVGLRDRVGVRVGLVLGGVRVRLVLSVWVGIGVRVTRVIGRVGTSVKCSGRDGG